MTKTESTPGEILKEIISLDEGYKNMFQLNEKNHVTLKGSNKDFVIVSVINYDDKFNTISVDYYYINKISPEKIFLFNTDKYDYYLSAAANENEFILSTKGFNIISGETEDNEHSIICRITEQGAVTERTE